MKKYFVVDSEEEVMIGDVISVDFEKKVKDGITLKRTEEFKVTEDSIPYLLDMGIIVEEDVNDEDLEDFDDSQEEAPCEIVESLIQDIEELFERVEKLENKQNKPKKEAKK